MQVYHDVLHEPLICSIVTLSSVNCQFVNLSICHFLNPMHSFIISGGTKKTRQEHIQNECAKKKIKPYDIVSLSLLDNSIGIEDVRVFQKRLVLIPYASPFTFGIINDADYLTIEAQQALLKTLEEPPSHVLLYLEVENIDALIPTIRSRCQHIFISSDRQANGVDDEVREQLQKLLDVSFASRARIIDTIASTRDSALLFTQKAILSARIQMKDSKTRKQGKILLQLLFLAREQLEANITPKLVFDAMCIKFQNT